MRLSFRKKKQPKAISDMTQWEVMELAIQVNDRIEANDRMGVIKLLGLTPEMFGEDQHPEDIFIAASVRMDQLTTRLNGLKRNA